MDIKKKLITLVVGCYLLSAGGMIMPANAADDMEDLTLTDFPTQYSHAVISKGHYVNWAGVSSVSQFADEKGNFCFAVDEGERVSVYKTDQGSISKKISIDNPYDSFGAAACGADGSLYMVWGYNNDTDDRSVETIIVSKYTPEGVFVASAGGNGSEGMPYYYGDGFYTKTPFSGGNCDVAINGDLLMVNYARGMYSGHQANTLFAVDTATMTIKAGMTTYNSHSFDQRVTAYTKTGGFLLESQGDCFPRSFATTVTNSERNLGQMNTFNFWVEKDAYSDYDMYKLNATRARLGNILETSHGAALVAASARSLSEAAKTEPYDVFVQVFDPVGSANDVDSYVTSGVRSGLAGNNGDTEVTDYGVYWLTDLAESGKTVEEVQAVSIENDGIAVLYELYQGSRYDSTWCMVLNGDGSVAIEATSLGAVRLNVDEDPVYAQGTVQWVSNGSDSDKLVLHALHIVTPKSDVFGNANELEWTYSKGSVMIVGPFSAEEPVIAACYAADGALLDVKIMTQSGDEVPMLDNTDVMKLFWIDSMWKPKCIPAEISAN